MDLGRFSMSLAVKDLATSKAFYEKLGFEVIEGSNESDWTVMRNGDIHIGLFQGMFTENILTFNPEDGRAILKQVRNAGLQPRNINNEEGEDAISFHLDDPDGNEILMDQFEESYRRKLRPKGRVLWTDLTVPDAEPIRDFYEAVLGWGHQDVSMGEYSDYNMNSDGETVAGICHKKGENESLPAQWLNYIRVEDLDASLEQVKEKGGKVLAEPRGDAGSRFAVIEDPAGAVCALSE